MTIKGFGIDLEGTMINLEEIHHKGHITASAEMGVVISFEECLKEIPRFIGGGDRAVAEDFVYYFQKIAGRTFLPHEFSEKVEEFVNRKRRYYQKMIRVAPIKLRPGVRDALEWMTGQGYKVTIGSLTITDQAKLLLEKSGLLQMIGRQNILLREDVDNIKPNPEVWLKTAKIMGISLWEQIIFDDGPVGLLAAKLAGSRSIAMPVYNLPQVLTQVIQERPVRIFMDWREINWPALIKNLNQE